MSNVRRLIPSSNMNSVQQIAKAYPNLVVGSVKETEDVLRGVEDDLGITLPHDVRWLLLNCGYGTIHAILNIRQTVHDTQRFRSAANLPHHYIVLEDGNDAGAVLLNTNSEVGQVVWIDTHAIWKLKDRAVLPSEANQYEAFVDWVEHCLQETIGDADA
jgi:hypothetical protein